MLDVHPPEHAAHSWRDFFTHIATIVVGLLIAVALEQTVERIHEHYELRETRAALAEEREANRSSMATDQQSWLVTYAELRGDLLALEYLRQHPGVPQTQLPTEILWRQSPFLWQHAVWDSAEQNGVVHRMPLKEANQNENFYALMKMLEMQNMTTWDAVNDAAKYNLVDSDPTHMTPAELENEIPLVRIALEKHFEQGYSLARAAAMYPDMPQRVTYTLLGSLRPNAYDLDTVGMKVPHQHLLDAMKDMQDDAKR